MFIHSILVVGLHTGDTCIRGRLVSKFCHMLAGLAAERQTFIFFLFFSPPRCNFCGNFVAVSTSRPILVPTSGLEEKADDAGAANAVHCICRSMQKLSNVLCCPPPQGWEKRLSLARHPLQSVNTEDRVGPPTPCASPELMKHSNASNFPKPNAQGQARYTLSFSHAATCIGLLVWRLFPSPLYMVRKGLKLWLLAAGQHSLG